MPKVSIVIPWHFMENWQFFLTRCLESVEKQTFKDYEVVLVKHSTMPITSNRAIESAQGEIIKVLYMDDYLHSPDALTHLVELDETWMVSGCLHDDGTSVGSPHMPLVGGIPYGRNTIGSPSVLAFRRGAIDRFDESMSWMLDVDLYTRLLETHGPPSIIPHYDVAIGVGKHQMTHLLSESEKEAEVAVFKQKHGLPN